MTRRILFIAAVLLCAAACAPFIKLPSCGDWHKRGDGNTCRECVDRGGRYAQCHN